MHSSKVASTTIYGWMLASFEDRSFFNEGHFRKVADAEKSMCSVGGVVIRMIFRIYGLAPTRRRSAFCKWAVQP
jgi:hypothetical protein